MKLRNVLIGIALLLGPLMVCAGQSSAAPPPITAAELTAYLAQCPDFKSDQWPIVDQLHDQLIADWRALPATHSALALQRGLESRFADDIEAVTGISSKCVSTFKLSLEEAWLRRRLAELRVRTSVPATDEVIIIPKLRQRSEVTNARTKAIRALQILLVESERHFAQGESPLSTSIFTPSDAEISACRSFAKCIEAISDDAGRDASSRMRERLSAAIARTPRDLPIERARVIVRGLPALDARQSECLESWIEGQRALRATALQELSDKIMAHSGDTRQLTELLHLGTGELGALTEMSECLPQGTAADARALLGHWDALADPISTARALIGDRGASEILEFAPADVTSVSIVDVVVRLPDGGLADYERLWGSVLNRDLGAVDLNRLRAAFRQSHEFDLPKVQKMLSAISADGYLAGLDETAVRERARMVTSMAQGEVVRAIITLESRLAANSSNGSFREGTDSLVQLERLSQAFAVIPLSHLAALGMQYPQAVSPWRSIQQSGLTVADHAVAVRVCTDHSERLLRNYRQLVLAVIDSHVRDAARVLDHAELREMSDRMHGHLPMPHPEGRGRPDEADCWRSMRAAWDAWLLECEAVRQDLRSSLPTPVADTIIIRWLLACFPVLRDLTDVHNFLEPAVEEPPSRFRRLVISALHDLERSAFSKRTGITWNETSDDVGHVSAALQQIRFDGDNLKERSRRICETDADR